MKVIITDISEGDAYYSVRSKIIGKSGTMTNIDQWDNGWTGCDFTFSRLTKEIKDFCTDGKVSFFEIKYKTKK
ncbi:MAG: hypothetical protein WC222_11230 [Parachlamydiales bacterium]|jgi:hypothetical protein